MKRKALFFDVDGTLLSEITHQIPASAVEALKEARKKGHLVFINSGRVRCHLNQIEKEITTDGLLCGCGTYVEAEGKTLYSASISHERGIRIKKDIDRFGIKAILEGEHGCYMQDPPYDDPRVVKFRNDLAKSGVLAEARWSEFNYQFDKFCVLADEGSNKDGFFKTLEDDFQVICRGNGFYECVPEGHSKATAIKVILDRYGIPLGQAYVFGDSMNDFPMFEYAVNAVLMGKHDVELEPYASFITKTVEEDGIWFAMKELGI